MNKKFMFPKHIYREDYFYDYDDSLEVEDKKRIVFLDIDGVICHNCFESSHHDLEKTAEYLAWKYHDDIYTKIRETDIGLAYYDWDNLAIGRLKQFLYESESEVVIHSDWCWNTDLEYLKALFRLHAMDDYIYDKCRRGDKKEIIKEYLELHKDIIENYVIFEDNPAVQFDDHFVLTKKLLTQKNIKDAYKILDR